MLMWSMTKSYVEQNVLSMLFQLNLLYSKSWDLLQKRNVTFYEAISKFSLKSSPNKATPGYAAVEVEITWSKSITMIVSKYSYALSIS